MKRASPPPAKKVSAKVSAPESPLLTRWGWAVVAGLILVFFYPITFGKVFLSPDSVAPAGFARIALEALKTRHVYALWNPYHFLGMPSFGSLTFVPFVYPLDIVFGFLNKTLHFPDLTWLLAHYLLMGLSMLLFLRALGAAPEGAVLGAVTFALTPNLVAVGAFGHGSQIMTAAYIPLLLYLLDRYARRGSLLWLAAFAAAAALQLLRSHVQIVFYTWLALGGYALFLTITAAKEGRKGEAARALGGLAVGLGLAFGMSAFLYLPTHEYAALSVRGGGEGGGAGLPYATAWSFSPAEILTFVIPSMFGFGGRTYWGSMPFTDYPNYMGIVPLMLAIYGAMRWPGKVRWYLLAMSGIALLMSFGKHFQPLYSLLYYHLPFFNKFRVPVMILVLVQFATAALAAFGVTKALERPSSRDKGKDPGAPWVRAGILAAVAGVAVTALLHALSDTLVAAAQHGHPNLGAEGARQALDMASLDAIKSALVLGIGFLVVGFARRGRMIRSAAALALLLVTVADLWVIDRKIIDPQVGSAEDYAGYFRETPEVTFLKSDRSLFRVYPLEWNDSRLAAYGVASVMGYHPAKPKLYQALADTAGIMSSLDMLKFLNVKYVLLDGKLPDTTPGVTLRRDGDIKVYEILGALPRAYVVHRLKPVLNDVVALATIRTRDFDPAQEVIWTEPDPLPPMGAPAVPDSVRVIGYDFNEAEFMVSTTAPGLFVLTDQWDPDWKATVDGKSAAIHRVDYLLRGILIGPGVHRIRFTYVPHALEAGIKISTLSLALTVLLAGAGFLLSRRRPREETT